LKADHATVGRVGAEGVEVDPGGHRAAAVVAVGAEQDGGAGGGADVHPEEVVHAQRLAGDPRVGELTQRRRLRAGVDEEAPVAAADVLERDVAAAAHFPKIVCPI
jgi:hypothetical protein